MGDHRVKRLLNRIRSGAAPVTDGAAPHGFFSTMFDEREDATTARTAWPDRAAALQAQVIDPAEGRRLLEKTLANDLPTVDLSRDEMDALLQCFQFASIASGREVISQDERGDYLMLLLDGLMAVDRVQLWGDRVNLGEARAGDVLGEMSLLDAGPRFSTCTTLKDTRVAVLDAQALDRLIRDQPRPALALVTMMARRMSLRLRYVSTRLTALLVRR
jgi:CRP/FNR family transcriptional regulator, cyclic AMP receptor protein